MKQILLLVLIFAAFRGYSHGQWGDLAGRLGIGKANTLTDSRISSGLKEALQVGTDNAVRLAGRKDGYFGNPAIKILLPERMRHVEKGLRTAGYGPQVDQFVLSMNRAAEKAAPAARQIFIDAILQMSFDDVRKIYNGGDTAATDYFRSKTNQELAEAFRPIVERATNETGVTQQYKHLVDKTRAIPFIRADSFDLDGYIVAKALDGLFYELGQQERNIRENPQARVTGLLQEVFGNGSAQPARAYHP
jgi:hypothetical protein